MCSFSLLFLIRTLLAPRIVGLGPLAIGAIGALGSIAGGLISSGGQKDANRANLQIAREQMAFQERMSNTAVRRAQEDWRAAGFNPMLAMMNPASSPSGASTTFGNEAAPIGAGIANATASAAGAATAVQQMKQLDATTSNVNAQTRKTTAEAAAIESTLPYSAQNAKVQSETLIRQYTKLGHEIHQIMRDEQLKDIEIDQVKPLLIEFQRLQNQGEQLGLAGKKAEEEFYKMLGPGSKALELLQKFLPFLSNLGRRGPR